MHDSTPIARRPRRVTPGLYSTRRDRGLTLTALAGQVGVTPEYLSRVERGIRHPGSGLLVRLSDVLGAPLDEISRAA